MIKRIWVIALRELKGFFNSPTAYVLLTVWTAVTSYFFFREAYLSKEASLRPLFQMLPWFIMFFVPAVSMRSIAAEKKDGTMEILLTHPVGDAEVVAGKLLANVLFMLTALALTLTMPLGLSLGGSLDIGMIAGQYIGAVFLILGLASVGIFASSISRNQTTAFIVALAVCFVLLASGLSFVIIAVPQAITAAVRQVSALSHFDSIARGVITISDISYFIALTAVFVSLSYFAVRRERESAGSKQYNNLRAGTALIAIISILGALIATTVGGRVDLTEDRLYSLSPASIEIVRDLKDPVTITLYASNELPAEVEPIRRDARDMIVDIQTLSKGHIKSVVKLTGNGQTDLQKVAAIGVQPVRFNVVSQDEFQVKQGCLGLTVAYKNKTEVIPFISQTADLEYRLASLIKKISNEQKKKIGFISGEDQGVDLTMGAQNSGYAAWKESLREQYEIEDLNMNWDRDIPDDIDVVVIEDSRSDVPSTATAVPAVGRFLKNGGSVMAMVESVAANENTLSAKEIDNQLTKFAADHGLPVEPNLVFDMNSNQSIVLGEEKYVVAYPFWLKTQPGSDSSIVSDLESILVPWGNSISSKAGSGVEPLLTTSGNAGVQTEKFNISPNVQINYGAGELRRYVLAAAKKTKGGGRLIVIGNSLLFNDKFLGISPDNAVFGQNSIDWLAQDLALTKIRSKSAGIRPLVFSSDLTRDSVRYFNLIGIPVLISLLGLARMVARRRLTGRAYEA